jgi:catechol 2,3-dioxygenase-like lactoylglutathione lyase family enzyme
MVKSPVRRLHCHHRSSRTIRFLLSNGRIRSSGLVVEVDHVDPFEEEPLQQIGFLVGRIRIVSLGIDLGFQLFPAIMEFLFRDLVFLREQAVQFEFRPMGLDLFTQLVEAGVNVWRFVAHFGILLLQLTSADDCPVSCLLAMPIAIHPGDGNSKKASNRQERHETERTRPAMFSHVTIGVSHFEAAFAFYGEIAAVLGLELKFREDARAWAGWKSPGCDRPLFIVTAPYDGNPASSGNGSMTAFIAGSRRQVDAAFETALAAGGASEGAPGLRPEYHAHYYGAYFRDPDGNKLCVCCHEAE